MLVNFILFFLFSIRARRRDDRGEQRKKILPLIFISLKARKIFNELYFMLLCGTGASERKRKNKHFLGFMFINVRIARNCCLKNGKKVQRRTKKKFNAFDMWNLHFDLPSIYFSGSFHSHIFNFYFPCFNGAADGDGIIA